ncbi:MAG: peroxidase family protein [Egibacteraceae bacterium]
MAAGRSTVKDGFANKIEFYATTHFAPVWKLIQDIEPVRRRVNRTLINQAILKMPCRPNPFSTMAGYTSWDSLTDRTFDSRHLPPREDGDAGLPSVDDVAELFMRSGETKLCPKSTVLFSYFAQWFTDGFLRSDRPRSPDQDPDPRKNDSNHEIDLTPLYGPRPDVTRRLREGSGGLLKSQIINGEEYPPYLCKDARIKSDFEGLVPVRFNTVADEHKDRLFAVGGDTVNSQVGFVMMNVLFLREHNRIARSLAERHQTWDDERLFETARNILIVLLIKIVAEEYINHIIPYHFQFRTDPQAFRNEPWYRTNWMAVEFNLLYRWHSLVPSTYRIDGQDLSVAQTQFNTEIVTRRGLGPLFEDASNQRAGRIGLCNTDQYLLPHVEPPSIKRGRAVRLASYNDYRAHCRFPRVTDFDQISGDPNIQSALRRVYGNVDRIEFYVGLFAEDLRPNSALPPLLGRMVGIDAFSQALTNPLLAARLFNEDTFSPLGMELIRTTNTLSDLLHRNLAPGSPHYFVSMTRRGWKRT